MTETKVCKKCGLEKPLIEFYKKKKDKSGNDLAFPCKECRKSYRKERRKYCPIKRREEGLKHLYNITIDDYNKMLKFQNYKCAICSTSSINYRSRNGSTHFSVDHCHTTGKIRGLLCCICNIGLGNFKDNTDLLNRASMYLQFSRDNLEYYNIDGKKLNNLMEVDNTQ